MQIVQTQPDYKESLHLTATSAKVGLAGYSFANLDLNDMTLSLVEFEGARFTNSRLSKTTFAWCKLRRVSFAKCKMNAACISYTNCDSTDFSSADMREFSSIHNKYKKANFDGADLTGANFSGDDLRGAKLSGAIMDAVKFERCKYDATTSFPPSLRRFRGLEWVGKGKNPLMDVLKKNTDTKCETLGAFVSELTTHLDQAKVKKALAMLKKETFQLYSESSAEKLSGIVKSQTDPDLVYACYLDSDGNFCCCTQNLRACGGLKGSLCKHLFVLVIGLISARVVNPRDALLWCLCSTLLPPQLDKDAMTQLFLKWKSADSIDWRPTETIPEDYYVF